MTHLSCFRHENPQAGRLREFHQFDIETGKLVKGCGELLNGEARFCPKCGNESNFFQKGWLNDWKGENVKQAIRNFRSAGQTPVPFDKIKKEKAE
jgi:hypothetical protein